MRKAVMPFVLSVGLLAVWAAPANAVQSRPSYVTQADPVCLAAVQQEAAALTAFGKAYKQFKGVKHQALYQSVPPQEREVLQCDLQR